MNTGRIKSMLNLLLILQLIQASKTPADLPNEKDSFFAKIKNRLFEGEYKRVELSELESDFDFISYIDEMLCCYKESAYRFLFSIRKGASLYENDPFQSFCLGCLEIIGSKNIGPLFFTLTIIGLLLTILTGAEYLCTLCQEDRDSSLEVVNLVFFIFVYFKVFLLGALLYIDPQAGSLFKPFIDSLFAQGYYLTILVVLDLIFIILLFTLNFQAKTLLCFKKHGIAMFRAFIAFFIYLFLSPFFNPLIDLVFVQCTSCFCFLVAIALSSMVFEEPLIETAKHKIFGEDPEFAILEKKD